MPASDSKSAQTKAVVPARFMPPAMSSVTPVQKVSGQNTAKVNLRDNPELNGMTIIVTDARLNAEGSAEYAQPYLVAKCFIFPPSREATPEDARVLVTGSGNVYERLLDCKMNNAFPISGTLRKSGRAWFLD